MTTWNVKKTARRQEASRKVIQAQVLATMQHQVHDLPCLGVASENIRGCCAMQSWGGGDDIELVQSYRPHEARLRVPGFGD